MSSISSYIGVGCWLPLATFIVACAGTGPTAATGDSHPHGTISSLSIASTDDWKACAHKVPCEVCVQCRPERAAKYKERGDWCEAHDRPESQCLICNPDLDFSPPKTPPKEADVVQIVKDGEDIANLEAHLVPGKVTIFDFHAIWCPPCRKVDEHLYPTLVNHDDIALRKIDVSSWDSPVAERWLKGVAELPYIVIYDKRGKKRAAIAGAQLEAIDRAIEEAHQ